MARRLAVRPVRLGGSEADMRILGLITARGGSKGIERKNVRSIAGKPLIAWTVEAALRSERLADLVVSTEDQEIADAARDAGARVPFMRPADLAADTTPGIDPVLHAIEMLPGYDAVLLLQPTSPLRAAEDIDGLLALADRTEAPSIVSVCAAEEQPAWMYRLADGGRMEPLLPEASAARRQDLPPVYTLNGALYFATLPWLAEHRSFIGPGTLGYPMPAERSIDIDGPLDWRIAEMLLQEGAR